MGDSERNNCFEKLNPNVRATFSNSKKKKKSYPKFLKIPIINFQTFVFSYVGGGTSSLAGA